MKVGIFETEHFEGSYPVIKLFDNGKNELTIFSYKISYDQFKFLFGNHLQRYNWIVKNDNLSKISFIYLIFKKVKELKIEQLYLNTITNNFIFYAILVFSLPKVRVIVTIHDINGYFELNRPYSIRKLVRYLGKKLILLSVKEFNVVSLTMVQYLQNKLPDSKVVHCIPGSIFEAEEVFNFSDEEVRCIQIVVPGIVDKRRRNYEIVFELLEKCNELNFPICITLLGGISKEFGSNILEKILLYSANHSNLKFYNTLLVDQPEFDQVMNRAHFVFIPTVINTVISDDVEEIYGKSIASGNIFDIVKHAKPFIAPELLAIDHFLEPSCIRYQNLNAILSFIHDVLENPKTLQSWQERAFNASKNFTLEKVIERNKEVFE